MELTRADQFRDVSVARDLPVRDLLHRAVDGVEECCCFVGAGHLPRSYNDSGFVWESIEGCQSELWLPVSSQAWLL